MDVRKLKLRKEEVLTGARTFIRRDWGNRWNASIEI